MQRRFALAILVILAPAATARADRFDHWRDWPDKYPAFFDAGLVVRHFAAVPGPAVAFRGASAPESEAADSAFAGDLRFGLRFSHHLRIGIEGEFGKLSRPGSDLAGAYVFTGFQAMLGGVSLGAELAGGQRTIRYTIDDQDRTRWLLEPRVHADVWLGPQCTLGAIAGATLGDRTVTMIGFYIGLHSSWFDRDLL